MINIQKRLKEAFPDREFTIKTQVYVNDTDFYFSNEFVCFLDKLSEELTDDEYINTDFFIDEHGKN